MSSITLNQIATSDPKKYVSSSHFLFNNEKKLWVWFFSSLLILVFVFFKFFPQEEFDSKGVGVAIVSHLFTAGLYTFIFFLAIRGGVMVATVLAKIQVENAIAIKIKSNTSNELRAIRSKEKQRIELEKIEHLFPDNPNNDLSTLRLAKNIIEEAKDRNFESAIVLMEPYKEESISDIFKINVIQKTALQLGILGTFIGLVSAFTGLNRDGLESQSLISEIIPSLEYSFTTSIAGLITAIVIGLFLILVRRSQDSFFKNMEDATNSLLALARNSINRDDFLSEFNQINSSVKQLDNRVYEQTQEVNLQTRSISNGLDKLNEVNNKFNGFLHQLSEKERKFLEDVRSLHEILSPKEFSQQLKESMHKSVEGISLALDNSLSEKIKKHEELDNSSMRVNESLVKLVNSLELQQSIIAQSNSHIENLKNTFNESLASIGDSQEDFIGKITGSHFSQKFREDFITVSSEFSRAFSEDLKSLSSGIDSYKDELSFFNQNARRYFDHRLVFERRLLIVTTVVVAGIGMVLLYNLLF